MRFGLISLGCPKNEVDSELIAGGLVGEGLDYSSRLEESDLVVLNTCAFIDSAISESYSWLTRLVQLKKDGVIKRIAVVGCLPQRFRMRLLKELEDVDYLAGTGYPREIGVFLARSLKGGVRKGFFFKPSPNIWVENGIRFPLKKAFYAYVKIAEGCDNRCNYCVIPQIRGPYRGRPLDNILNEAEAFVKEGKKELILVSQDSTMYPHSLPLLLRKLSEINGDFWIRVLYLHPARVNEELIETILSLRKVCSYFDIPIQHVDDEVLKLMGRPYGERELRMLFNRIRSLDALACLRTTIMVGFPGERRCSFDKLLDFIDDVKFDRLGSFSYSPQAGTASYFLKPPPLRVSRNRRHTLMELQRKVSRERNGLFVGKILRVLVEKPRVGRSYRDAPEIDGLVYLDRDVKVGSFVDVKIEKAGDYDLWGKVIQGIEV